MHKGWRLKRVLKFPNMEHANVGNTTPGSPRDAAVGAKIEADLDKGEAAPTGPRPDSSAMRAPAEYPHHTCASTHPAVGDAHKRKGARLAEENGGQVDDMSVVALGRSSTQGKRYS